MRAVRFHEYGAPTCCARRTWRSPSPGPGRSACGSRRRSFNGIDGNIRGGFMQGPIPVTLPHVPGIDVAGTSTRWARA